MKEFEIKEQLAICLDALEDAYSILEELTSYDKKFHEWHEEIEELYGKILIRFET